MVFFNFLLKITSCACLLMSGLKVILHFTLYKRPIVNFGKIIIYFAKVSTFQTKNRYHLPSVLCLMISHFLHQYTLKIEVVLK